jgi:hypothetical protein
MQEMSIVLDVPWDSRVWPVQHVALENIRRL